MKKIINIIKEFKNLKYINLDLGDEDSNFISFFLKEYKNDKLIKFKSKIYDKNNINIFLENNSNIEKINLDFRNDNNDGKYFIIKNEKSKIKNLILNHLNIDFYICPSKLEIIKLINFHLFD